MRDRVSESNIARQYVRIVADELFREELEVCADLSIGHETFRSWSTGDQAKAIALRRYRRTVCPDCGTRADDWQDTETNDMRDDPKFEPLVIRCFGCQSVEQTNADIHRETRHEYERRGLKVVMAPRRGPGAGTD